MQLFFCAHIAELFTLDDPQEVTHLVRVLRKKEGDHIFFTNGLGSIFETEMMSFTPKTASFRVIHETKYERRKPYVHLAIAPTKNIDRMEWLLEKATEIGVDEISWIYTKQSERREIKNYDRLMKCMISAVKQSKNPFLPVMNEMQSFPNFLKNQVSFSGDRFIAYCPVQKGDQMASLQSDNLLFLIGPEGDFSPTEVEQAQQAGFTSISLGPHILRTETAALALVVKSKWG